MRPTFAREHPAWICQIHHRKTWKPTRHTNHSDKLPHQVRLTSNQTVTCEQCQKVHPTSTTNRRHNATQTTSKSHILTLTMTPAPPQVTSPAPIKARTWQTPPPTPMTHLSRGHRRKSPCTPPYPVAQQQAPSMPAKTRKSTTVRDPQPIRK